MHHLRRSWLRALPPLARPIAQTMPWVTLLAGCLAGTGYLAVIAGTSHSPLGPGSLRFASLPAVAALAFVPSIPFRPLTQATPVPAWVTPAGHLLLAAPILAMTCWTQLRIIAHTIPPHTVSRPPAAYPVIAQVTGWCVVTVAVACWLGRSRYADLGGAIGAPVSLAAIALAWYAPGTRRLLSEPPAGPGSVTTAWYAIAAAALALTCMAMRDQWHRYLRGPGPGRGSRRRATEPCCSATRDGPSGRPGPRPGD